jgi:hypothetical protein
VVRWLASAAQRAAALAAADARASAAVHLLQHLILNGQQVNAALQVDLQGKAGVQPW